MRHTIMRVLLCYCASAACAVLLWVWGLYELHTLKVLLLRLGCAL
jgi:hypothetical protein